MLRGVAKPFPVLTRQLDFSSIHGTLFSRRLTAEVESGREHKTPNILQQKDRCATVNVERPQEKSRIRYRENN